MQITALAGGVGGARFLRGLCDHLRRRSDLSDARLTIVGNTGDDITMFGLRVCPDLDTLMYTLGDGIDESQGWGRVGDTRTLQGELAAYGVQPQWFGLGDLDLATHVARSQWLGQGATLSEVVARLGARWGLDRLGVTLLPMSDDPVETHVVIDDEDGRRAIHFQEWWVRHQAGIPARTFTAVGLDRARPAPGVLEAIRGADVVLLPPSNPVVSIGIVLGVPGVRDALRGCAAPVVGVSPIVGGAPVRGHADACLAALGLPTTPDAVAGLYEDFLDRWLVAPGDAAGMRRRRGLDVLERPLLMRDRTSAAELAGAALDAALDAGPRRG
ncbi:2-phospho-L-lactate transferase [Agilicoccus flavus]|uniref:2-phospho-L-lactate transferase n=1 Tax=Agilicoccus flavus TaxID=2775968 RepID=UPI001CF673EE|nr:2-phospho-L-lactate transferase [Agilicoccus flavus]